MQMTLHFIYANQYASRELFADPVTSIDWLSISTHHGACKCVGGFEKYPEFQDERVMTHRGS